MKKLFLMAILACLSACNKPRDHKDMADYHKPVRGDYWATRYSYPTFQYQQNWLAQARKEHQKVAQRTPAGIHRQLADLKGMKTDAFVALGPKPLIGSSNFSGRVNVIVSHPTDPSMAWAGVDGGGVWKTTTCCDANTQWKVVTDQAEINGAAIGDLHLDPNDPDIIYAGTGDLRYGSYSFGSAGLLRSSDGGTSWEVLGEEVFDPYRDQPPGDFPQYQAIGRVRTNPLNSSQIIVGTKTGLFLSHNNGVDWTSACQTNVFSSQRQDVTGMEISASGDIYVAIGTRGHNTTVQPDLDQNGANGIYHATFPASGCPSFSLVSTNNNGWPTGSGRGVPYPFNSLGRIDLAMAPSDNEVLYAQVADVDNFTVRGVWKTTDGGNTWSQVATTNDIGGCAGPGNQAWYDMGITVAPDDPDTLFLSAVDLVRSTDGGITFTNVTCGYAGGPANGDFVHVDHHARSYIAGNANKLLVGSDGGVYASKNADTFTATNMSFTHLNDSINTIEFYSGDISADFINSVKRIAVGGAQDNGSSVAIWDTQTEPLVAKPWVQVNGGDGIYATIEPINASRVYVESQFGNMRISTTGPLGSYNRFVNPWNSDNRIPFLFPFHLNKHDCAVSVCEQLMAGTYRIWETVNGGLNNNSWYINSPDLTKNNLGNRSIINQMHYGITDASVAIVGTNDGNVYFGFGMGQGSSNSATWVNVTDGNAVLPNRPILDVVTSGFTATTGYAAVGGFDQNTPATPGHLFEVTCDANCANFSWKNKSGNLPNIPVDSVMVNPNIENMIFAGTDWGLYYTENIEADEPTWYRFTNGIPSVMIWDLTIDRGATTLAAFTRSRGAYVWPLPLALDSDLIFADDFE